MHYSLLARTISINQNTVVDVFITTKEGKVGLEFWKEKSDRGFKKSVYISEDGYKAFLSNKWNILEFFQKGFEKMANQELTTTLEGRRSGETRLRMYTYNDIPYVSLVYYKLSTEVGSRKERMRPTGYQCIFTSEDIVAFYTTAQKQVDDAVSELKKVPYTNLVFEFVAALFFSEVLGVYKLLSDKEDLSNAQVELSSIINSYYDEITTKILQNLKEDELLFEVERKYPGCFTRDEIISTVHELIRKDQKSLTLNVQKRFSSWHINILVQNKPQEQQAQLKLKQQQKSTLTLSQRDDNEQVSSMSSASGSAEDIVATETITSIANVDSVAAAVDAAIKAAVESEDKKHVQFPDVFK